MDNLKARIKEFVLRKGADLVGFANIERFTGVPAENDPLRLLPEAQTVVCLGFRLLRGSFRGVENGSTFYNFPTMSVELLEETIMPNVLLQTVSLLEDAGVEAVPQRRHQLIRTDRDGTNPEVNFSRIYRGISGQAELDFRYAAIACGLGEAGLSGSVLTDDFGPWQRFCAILISARLEPDDLVEPHLCDSCGACRNACPGQALTGERQIAGCAGAAREIFRRDDWQCAAYYRGASRKTNPYMPPDAFQDLPDRLEIMNGQKHLDPNAAQAVMSRLKFYGPIKHSYVPSICGRACDRACYVHLEEKAVLKRQFVEKFRKRPVWELPLDE